MTTTQIVRSWKDEDYFATLSVEEQALLPKNPAGLIELTDEELLGVDGGSDSALVCSVVLTIGITIGVGISKMVCSK
jgi:mersacidin/lichenicidin family type 2 lantibiotic